MRTFTKKLENGKITAKAELKSIGSQKPYFSITGTIFDQYGRVETSGCIHAEIAEHFPALAPFIKWHLVSVTEPMYYIGNTTYHAGNLDCWGKEGKERDFDAARHCAIWPEATDEQLSLPKETLTILLQSRLPALMAEFQADMTKLFGESLEK